MFKLLILRKSSNHLIDSDELNIQDLFFMEVESQFILSKRLFLKSTKTRKMTIFLEKNGLKFEK